MSELKFRVWDNVDYMSSDFTFQHIIDSTIQFTPECKIMQFTGLKDKNGIDIYEGDIVRPFGDQGSLAQIIFFAPSFKLATKLNNGSYNLWNYYKDEIEIVGNIYQNPELINKQ